MSFSKKVLIALLSLLIPFGAIGVAQAAEETVTAETTLTPRAGSFFKEVNRASNLSFNVVLTPGPGQALVDPMKNVRVTFPAGMTFRPNNRVCPDSRLNEQSALGSPSLVLNSCRNSVVGTGTATILLARQVSGALADPILIAFNAGRTGNGLPRLKIYGYSKGTGVGILMTGVLRGRVLDIAIPVLSFDSAVADFNLNFPGGRLNEPDIGVNTRGLDPNYVQARCANPRQVTNAVFQLGTRNPVTGADTGPTTTKTAPTTVKTCRGAVGRARLNARVVRKPRAVRNGAKGVFRIQVRNTGTASARGVVAVGPRGRARVGVIRPRTVRAFNIRATVRGNRGRMAPVRFVVRGRGVAPARAATRVRVR